MDLSHYVRAPFAPIPSRLGHEHNIHGSRNSDEQRGFGRDQPVEYGDKSGYSQGAQGMEADGYSNPEEDSEEEEAAEPDSDFDLEQSRALLDHKLKSRFEAIFEKYGKDFSGVGDEIDLRTGEIVVDNGHLLEMVDERDAGDAQTGRTMLRALTVDPDRNADTEDDDADDNEALDTDDARYVFEYEMNATDSDTTETEILESRPPQKLRFSSAMSYRNHVDVFLGGRLADDVVRHSVEATPAIIALPSEQDILAQFGPDFGPQIFKYVSAKQNGLQSEVEPAWRTPGLPIATPGRRPILESVLLQPEEERSPSPDVSLWAPPQMGRPRRRLEERRPKQSVRRSTTTDIITPTVADRPKTREQISDSSPQKGTTVVRDSIYTANAETPKHVTQPARTRNVDATTEESRLPYTADDIWWMLKWLLYYKMEGRTFWTPNCWRELALQNSRHSAGSWSGHFSKNYTKFYEAALAAILANIDRRTRGLAEADAAMPPFTSDNDRHLLWRVKRDADIQDGPEIWLRRLGKNVGGFANISHRWRSFAESYASHVDAKARGNLSIPYKLDAAYISPPETSNTHVSEASHQHSTKPSIKHFTQEDDRLMLDWGAQMLRDGWGPFTARKWAEFASMHPQHALHSWLHRYRKQYGVIGGSESHRPPSIKDSGRPMQPAQGIPQLPRVAKRPSAASKFSSRIPKQALDLFSESVESLRSTRVLRKVPPVRKEPNKVSWAEAVEEIENVDPDLYASLIDDDNRGRGPLEDSAYGYHRRSYSPEAMSHARAKSSHYRTLRAPGSTQSNDADDEDFEEGQKICICQEPEYGDLIACDNHSCDIEWFHWECVGVYREPQGSWYCPTCVQTFGYPGKNRDVGAQNAPKQQHGQIGDLKDRSIPDSQSSPTTNFSSSIGLTSSAAIQKQTPLRSRPKIDRNIPDTSYQFSDDEPSDTDLQKQIFEPNHRLSFAKGSQKRPSPTHYKFYDEQDKADAFDDDYIPSFSIGQRTEVVDSARGLEIDEAAEAELNASDNDCIMMVGDDATPSPRATPLKISAHTELPGMVSPTASLPRKENLNLTGELKPAKQSVLAAPSPGSADENSHDPFLDNSLDKLQRLITSPQQTSQKPYASRVVLEPPEYAPTITQSLKSAARAEEETSYPSVEKASTEKTIIPSHSSNLEALVAPPIVLRRPESASKIKEVVRSPFPTEVEAYSPSVRVSPRPEVAPPRSPSLKASTSPPPNVDQLIPSIENTSTSKPNPRLQAPAFKVPQPATKRTTQQTPSRAKKTSKGPHRAIPAYLLADADSEDELSPTCTSVSNEQSLLASRNANRQATPAFKAGKATPQQSFSEHYLELTTPIKRSSVRTGSPTSRYLPVASGSSVGEAPERKRKRSPEEDSGRMASAIRRLDR